MKELVIIGGGGHARATIDVVIATGEYKISGYIDSIEKDDILHDVRYLGDDSKIPDFLDRVNFFLICIGQIMHVDPRKKLYEYIKEQGGRFVTVVAPSAYVSPLAKIGAGTVIMHRAIVQAGVEIGENCIINDGAIVEHDVRIGNHVHLSTGAILNGGVQVGEDSFVGSGSVVVQNIELASRVVIGAGSVVTRNVKNGSLVKGNPAK